jgi:Baseplate J-like protein
MSITQPRRLNYTRRDILAIHDDVDLYISEFIPRIKGTSQANTGRLYLTIFEGLIDNLNYSVDQAFLESLLVLARQRKNIVQMAYFLGHIPKSTSASSVDLTFSMLSGVAGPGGQAIAAFQRVQTVVSPAIEFLTTEAATILEDETSVNVPAVQGTRVVDESLSAAASGAPNQYYTLAQPLTPHEFIEVKIDGASIAIVDDFAEANADEIVCTLQFDGDDYTRVIFGDGEYGKAPPFGSSITVTYIATSGEEGNVPAGTIQRVIGAIASVVGVTNALDSSGGASSESDESIKRNAPAIRVSQYRAVSREDMIAHANSVAGVYQSFAEHTEGSRTNVYVLPEGGGVASSLLLSQVQARLDARKIDGTQPKAFALAHAGILVSANVVTFDKKSPKALVKQKVRELVINNLHYTKLTRGRGFTLSDLSGLIEGLNDGLLIDYVDFSILSRVPRVSKSNTGAPDFIGRVTISSTAGYDTYVVTAISTSEFIVTKNGIPQSQQGVLATAYATNNNEVTFTLGETGDTLTVGDTWSFKTSRYRDNIVLDSNEFMYLERSSDLVVSVFYPGEYDLRTQAAL